VRDEIRGLRGAEPVLVSLVGPPGTAALMTSPDSEAGYRALIPADLAFRDRVSARILNRLGTYRPGRAAARVQCPILFCVSDEDALAPAATTVRYAAKAPRAEVKRYPIGHFDIYRGAPFDVAVADQVAFLRRHLGLASG
jgi:pimeloyl-ACP methyl ester carboxylesterase